MIERSGTPAYLQIANELRAKIQRGDLEVGAQLPSAAQLRAYYSVSTVVIRAAIKELQHEGLVIGQQGKGVFVRASPDAPARQDLVHKRLDALTESVQKLAERVARLEGDRAQEPP